MFSANNLYGGAQSCPLPLSDFKWLEPAEIAALDIPTMTENQNVGYILEVDLDNPKKLRKLTNLNKYTTNH